MSPLLSIFLHIDLTHFTSIREAWIIFKAGKNHNGYFDANDLLKQVNNAIDIFEGLTKGWAQGLFLFDNAPSHQKCAPDAISARHMVKGPLTISASHHHCCTRTGPKSQQRRNTDIPFLHHHRIRQALCQCTGESSSGCTSTFA